MPIEDRLGTVSAFVAAVDAGSFALAANTLGVTRSAVAKAVARLEARLGTRLFHRTTRTQHVTEDGQAYFERCRRALAELEAAEAAIARGRREPTGVLRVSAPASLGRARVAAVLAALAARYPALRVELESTDRRVDLVEEGFDLAIRIGVLADSTSIAARPLGTQRFAIVASPAWLRTRRLRAPSPWPAARFEGLPAIAYGRANRIDAWTRDGAALPVRYAMVCDDVAAIAESALAGQGLARLPTWLAQAHVDAGRLVVIDRDPPSRDDAIHAIWPAARALPAKVRLAIDALVDAFASTPSARAGARPQPRGERRSRARR